MPDEPTSRKSVTLPDRLWDAVSEFRFDERIRTETEALCRIVERGVEASRKSQ